MIEMLGVLAIIGVLSAGGIMGYTMAMENYRMNKFIEDIEIMGATATNIFTKNKEDVHIYADKLCDLGVITPEYCKKLSCSTPGLYTCFTKTPWQTSYRIFANTNPQKPYIRFDP